MHPQPLIASGSGTPAPRLAGSGLRRANPHVLPTGGPESTVTSRLSGSGRFCCPPIQARSRAGVGPYAWRGLAPDWDRYIPKTCASGVTRSGWSMAA